MRAIVLEEPGRLAEREVADPVPGPGEVLIEVAACGVCRTDLHILARARCAMRRQPSSRDTRWPGRLPARRAGRAWPGCAARRHVPATAGRPREPVRSRVFTGWTSTAATPSASSPARYVFPLPDGVHRGRCGAAALRRHHRLSLAAGGRIRAGRQARPVRLRRLCAPRDAGRTALGLRGVRFTRSQPSTSASRSGRDWAGGHDDPPPWPLDAAVTFAPAGRWSWRPCAALPPGGDGRHQRDPPRRDPAFSYDLLWRERLRSVATSPAPTLSSSSRWRPRSPSGRRRPCLTSTPPVRRSNAARSRRHHRHRGADRRLTD